MVTREKKRTDSLVCFPSQSKKTKHLDSRPFDYSSRHFEEVYLHVCEKNKNSGFEKVLF